MLGRAPLRILLLGGDVLHHFAVGLDVIWAIYAGALSVKMFSPKRPVFSAIPYLTKKSFQNVPKVENFGVFQMATRSDKTVPSYVG